MESFIHVTVFLLIVLWVYASLSKLLDFRHFQMTMHRQTLFPFLKDLLIYGLPPTELVIAAILLFDKLQKVGLYASFVLLSIFTGYIALVLMQVFGRVPCSCGGILEHMGWTVHLLFNLFFLTITLITLLIIKRKEPYQHSK